MEREAGWGYPFPTHSPSLVPGAGWANLWGPFLSVYSPASVSQKIVSLLSAVSHHDRLCTVLPSPHLPWSHSQGKQMWLYTSLDQGGNQAGEFPKLRNCGNSGPHKSKWDCVREAAWASVKRTPWLGEAGQGSPYSFPRGKMSLKRVGVSFLAEQLFLICCYSVWASGLTEVIFFLPLLLSVTVLQPRFNYPLSFSLSHSHQPPSWPPRLERAPSPFSPQLLHRY